jgi:hypothetical protein
MKRFLKNIVKLKKISTIKDFRFGTFPSISGSGSGSGYTFYRPPIERVYMIKYVGPISSCIFILQIFLVYVYKFKDILEKL